MHRKVYFLLVPILILVTLGISMGPGLLNSYRKKYLLESKSFWTYNEPENQEITDAELAQLYVNGTFRDGTYYSNGYNDADVLDTSAIKEQGKNVLSKVFGEDEAAFEKIESMMESEMVYYDRQVLLTFVGNRTMSFVFVNLIYLDGSDQIEVVYEEKTSTVFSFEYQKWDAEKTDWDFIESIFGLADKYSTNVLGLNKTQYATRFMDSDYEIIASFSLEQNMEGEKPVGEIDGTYYY